MITAATTSIHSIQKEGKSFAVHCCQLHVASGSIQSVCCWSNVGCCVVIKGTFSQRNNVGCTFENRLRFDTTKRAWIPTHKRCPSSDPSDVLPGKLLTPTVSTSYHDHKRSEHWHLSRQQAHYCCATLLLCSVCQLTQQAPTLQPPPPQASLVDSRACSPKVPGWQTVVCPHLQGASGHRHSSSAAHSSNPSSSRHQRTMSCLSQPRLRSLSQSAACRTLLHTCTSIQHHPPSQQQQVWVSQQVLEPHFPWSAANQHTTTPARSSSSCSSSSSSNSHGEQQMQQCFQEASAPARFRRECSKVHNQQQQEQPHLAIRWMACPCRTVSSAA